MDIDSLGEGKVEMLIDHDLVHNLADLYDLKYDQLLGLEKVIEATEDKKEKKTRLQAEAESKAGSKDAKKGPKPLFVKFGINHVTTLVEEGKAKLVVIPHDVDPIELMVFLPALNSPRRSHSYVRNMLSVLASRLPLRVTLAKVSRPSQRSMMFSLDNRSSETMKVRA